MTNILSSKKELINASKRLSKSGLNRGASGNLSIRLTKGSYLITPSGIPAEDLSIDQLVEMKINEKTFTGKNPSSEWQIHDEIYENRREVNAVVHTHSTFACVLSCLRKNIPSFHYMVALAGGNDIKCCDYALFGSNQLSFNVLNALKGRWACLMANHGLVSCSINMKTALYLAEEVESLCEQYFHTLSVGNVNLLTDNQMFEVIEKFKNYGFKEK